MLALHILAGLLGIASGASALMAAKSERLHVRVGLVFVGAMLMMASSGVVLALVRPNAFSTLNGIAATLTFYLVLTGLFTFHRASHSTRWIDAATALVGVSHRCDEHDTGFGKRPSAGAACARVLHVRSAGCTGIGGRRRQVDPRHTGFTLGRAALMAFGRSPVDSDLVVFPRAGQSISRGCSQNSVACSACSDGARGGVVLVCQSPHDTALRSLQPAASLP